MMQFNPYAMYGQPNPFMPFNPMNPINPVASINPLTGAPIPNLGGTFNPFANPMNPFA